MGIGRGCGGQGVGGGDVRVIVGIVVGGRLVAVAVGCSGVTVGAGWVSAGRIIVRVGFGRGESSTWAIQPLARTGKKQNTQ